MEIGGVKELSRYRYEKALRNLDIAASLYMEARYGAAQNRAYYAAFDGMRSVNALDGFDSSKHSGVIAHFNQTYVKPGKFPANTSEIIRRASRLREKSDYEDFYEPEQEETAQTIEEIRNFLEKVGAYLQSEAGLFNNQKRN